jgi:HicB family
VVILAPDEHTVDDFSEASNDGPSALAPRVTGDADDGNTSRINLRLPDQLKARVEQAANSEGLSTNTWLVRAASFALDRLEPGRRRDGHAASGAGRYTGWVR